ncbi:MAG: hypothetical protein KFF73_08265, partial [Cyclobacteriaceae bacterium]|nr:hypothetical protein [Cyclobacteriaceae bacterium]
LLQRLDSMQRISVNSQAAYISNTMISPDKFHWHVTELNEFRNDNIVLLESYITEKGSSSFMDKSLIYYFQLALMVAIDDNLEIRGLSQVGLSPIVSDRLKQNLFMKHYSDSLKLSLFDRHVVAEKIVSSGYYGKPVSYSELGDGRIRKLMEAGNNGTVLDFRPWYGDYYLLTGLVPVKGREIDKKVILQKIYFP